MQFRRIFLLPFLTFASHVCIVSSTVIAQSSINECIRYGEDEVMNKQGTVCGKKLVVALTISANEGMSQYIETELVTVKDRVEDNNVQLKNPVRIRVHKSPVLLNYGLYQVGYVNHKPTEVVVEKRSSRCRDDWFALDHEIACPFQYMKSGGETVVSEETRIFDSQGFCCNCNMNDEAYDRGEGKSCLGHSRARLGHCLRFDSLYYYALGLHPPEFQFNITIEVERLSYKTVDGEDIWEPVSTVVLGPHNRVAKSKDFKLRGEYLADFFPNEFISDITHNYLLVPDLSTVENNLIWQGAARIVGLWNSINDPKDWMLVPKEMFDFTGHSCNRIGVYYSAFRNHGEKCTSPIGSCLQNQPYSLWKEDKKKRLQNQPTFYFLSSYGKVHSASHDPANFQLNFLADKPRTSLLVLTLEADSLKVVVNKSPGRILKSYIDAFEALSSTGLLTVYVENTGSITANYRVFVVHCSAGIDFIPAQMVSIDPGVSTNVTFSLHSYHSIGQINHCEVELYNENSERLDNLTIYFQTTDTCFCYGYCGCTCGDNVTDCPPPPEFKESQNFSTIGLNFGFNLNFGFITDAFDKLKGYIADEILSYLGGFFVIAWIIGLVVLLGAIKVVIDLVSGGAIKDINPLNPVGTFFAVIGQLCSSLGQISSCCKKGTTVCFCCVVQAATGGQLQQTTDPSQRPLYCDGTCLGARRARKAYRKKLRMMKLTKKKDSLPPPWWKTKYHCTCVVRKNKSLFGICKGLFFFFYCPLLPVWWTLDFFLQWCKRSIRRRRRKRRFYALKEAKKAKDANTFLKIDDFTRGKVEKKTVDFDKSKKKKKNDKASNKQKRIEPSSSDKSLSSGDSSATDEAADIEELLNPGCPVYFNYATVNSKMIPPSLKNPGPSYSIKGQLRQDSQGYVFELQKFTSQTIEVVKGKQVALKPKNKLEPSDFIQVLSEDAAVQLITLSPLFVCLNGSPTQKK